MLWRPSSDDPDLLKKAISVKSVDKLWANIRVGSLLNSDDPLSSDLRRLVNVL